MRTASNRGIYMGRCTWAQDRANHLPASYGQRDAFMHVTGAAASEWLSVGYLPTDETA
jgi:hypothetical protein